jgi:hypothetical protein
MFTGNENHDISLEDAAAMTKKYRESMPPGSRKGGFFGRDALEAILAQTDAAENPCAGIRYYHGINDRGEPVIILVAAGTDENDWYTGSLAEFAMPCPNQCSANNPLNS